MVASPASPVSTATGTEIRVSKESFQNVWRCPAIPFCSFGFFLSSAGTWASSFPASPFSSASPSSDEGLLSESSSSLDPSTSLSGAPKARCFVSLVNDSPGLANEESFPPPLKGEPNEPPKPLVLPDARPENGEAPDAWLKFSVGF